MQVFPVSRLAKQTPPHSHSGVRHRVQEAGELASTKRRPPRGTRGRLGPGFKWLSWAADQRATTLRPQAPLTTGNPDDAPPSATQHSRLTPPSSVNLALHHASFEMRARSNACDSRPIAVTADLCAAVLRVLLVWLAIVRGAERDKVGHVDGERAGMTEVSGGESELEQAYGRAFLLDFQDCVLGAPDVQKLEDSSSVLGREAKSMHIGEHAFDGSRAVDNSRAVVGARAVIGVLAAARAAVAARAAAACAAAARAIIAAAIAAATGADEARTAKAGHSGGYEAGGRRPAGAGEAAESVHVRAAEDVGVAGAL
jgi:hypothetical protein